MVIMFDVMFDAISEEDLFTFLNQAQLWFDSWYLMIISINSTI